MIAVSFNLILKLFLQLATVLSISSSFFNNSLIAGGPSKMEKSFYDLSINDINGKKIDLLSLKGKKVMLVNVASRCGYTSQYADLQELYKEHKEKLEIIGIPCNDFGSQEPGTSDEIKSFCRLNYGVTFPLSEKQKIKSNPVSDLYKWLSDPDLNGWNSSLPSWNFCKYIIDEEGNLIQYFKSGIDPNGKEILELL